MTPSPIQEQSHTMLARRLHLARKTTDSLFELLDPKAITERPIRERHRILFYLGHFEAFDWNLLGKWCLTMEPFNEEFDQLFAFGIDPLAGELPTDVVDDWPPLSDITAYNHRVRQSVDRIFEEAASDRVKTVLNVAIEHRLMHAETLAYMLHWLPLNQKRRPLGKNGGKGRRRRVKAKMTPIPEGIATLGLPKQSREFGWDNEFEQMEVAVPAFSIDVFNVTNGEYLEFVETGGYQDRSLWDADDWNWISKNGIRHPRFWTKRTSRWMQLTMFELQPLPPSWPVYVSHAEATAYSRWLGKALPTEAQFHRAAYGTPDGSERPYPWGVALPDRSRGNFDLHQWDPAPVGSFPDGNSAFGVSDLVGNGWEWTSTVFEPFDGFERFEFYPGYSADFFDGKHFVVKGGSSRTSACMLRRSFRNWFQPNYPHIYATFRCVDRSL